MGVSTSLSVDVLVFPIIKFLSKSDTGSRCETGPGTMRLSTFRFLRLSHQNVMIHSHRDRSVFRHFCFWQNHQLDRLVDVKGESMLQPGSSRKTFCNRIQRYMTYKLSCNNGPLLVVAPKPKSCKQSKQQKKG